MRTSVIKHAHHGFDIDYPGKDSYRHRQAGAYEVLVASSRRLAVMREFEIREFEQARCQQIDDLLIELDLHVDWALVEGFRDSHLPKLEVCCVAARKLPIYPDNANVLAVAIDSPNELPQATAAAWLDLNDPHAVLDGCYITQTVLGIPQKEGPAMAEADSSLMPLEQALARLLDYVTPLAEAEQVPTLEADGRVLATSVISDLNVPPHDNAAMDGYAVYASTVIAPGTELPVAQFIPAGHVGEPLAAETAARIFTGAPMPHGADAVVMQEDTETLQNGHRVRFLDVPHSGQHVRRMGEDVARDAEVLAVGERLDPAAVGLAAGVGMAQLQVTRRPRVALFTTGDELVMPGAISPSKLPPGAIFNSNHFFLTTLLLRLGCEVQDMGTVPDRLDATKLAIEVAARQHDLILASGGVSVGEKDHVKPAVQALGTLELWKLAIKPGKPFAYGRIPKQKGEGDTQHTAHFIGLPGNPVSSFITFLLLVRPFLLKLQGARQLETATVLLPAEFDLPKPIKRREFLRARRTHSGGLELYPSQSSGVLTSVHWADGLIDRPAGSTIARGDLVDFMPFSDFLS